MSINYGAEPCPKCERLTNHKTGLCLACRTFICACGLKTHWKDARRDKCHKCIQKHESKNRLEALRAKYA